MNNKLLAGLIVVSGFAGVGAVTTGCGGSGGTGTGGASSSTGTTMTTSTGKTSSTGTGTTSTGTGTGTGTGSTGTGGTCSVTDKNDTCVNACTAAYNCALLTCNGTDLCKAPTGDAAEKMAFIGDDMSGCVKACNGTPLLKNFVDPTDCATTIDNLKGASSDFKTFCDGAMTSSSSGGSTSSTGP